MAGQLNTNMAHSAYSVTAPNCAEPQKMSGNARLHTTFLDNFVLLSNKNFILYWKIKKFTRYSQRSGTLQFSFVNIKEHLLVLKIKSFGSEAILKLR